MGFKYQISTPESVKHIAHEFCEIIKNGSSLTSLKMKRVEDPTCEFVLVFCPIVSHAGTDIEAALNKINIEFRGRTVILIVLHHTFDPESIVSDSSKFVNNEVNLTVDCLFHEDQGLLQCKRNSKVYKDVRKFMKSQNKKEKPQRRHGETRENAIGESKGAPSKSEKE